MSRSESGNGWDVHYVEAPRNVVTKFTNRRNVDDVFDVQMGRVVNAIQLMAWKQWSRHG